MQSSIKWQIMIICKLTRFIFLITYRKAIAKYVGEEAVEPGPTER